MIEQDDRDLLFCARGCGYFVSFVFAGKGQRWPQHCGQLMIRKHEAKPCSCGCGKMVLDGREDLAHAKADDGD